MQLVINIDDKLYEIIKNPKKLETMYHAGRLCEAVRNGTPLPKGHSALFDEKDLYKHLNKESDDNFVLRVDAIIDKIKPIIEADKINKK